MKTVKTLMIMLVFPLSLCLASACHRPDPLHNINLIDPVSRSSAPWPMRGYDIRHSGRSPHHGPSTCEIRWTVRTAAEVTSSPAIGADSTIYIGSWDRKLYAISPLGTVVWASPLAKRFIYSSPSIDARGSIFIGSLDHNFYALNPDGCLQCRVSTTHRIYSSPAIASNGMIRIPDYLGKRNLSKYLNRQAH